MTRFHYALLNSLMPDNRCLGLCRTFQMSLHHAQVPSTRISSLLVRVHKSRGPVDSRALVFQEVIPDVMRRIKILELDARGLITCAYEDCPKGTRVDIVTFRQPDG